MTPFSDPAAVSGYAARTVRIVPGLHDLHRMAGVLLAEQALADARILVLGAGGGLELKAFAEMQPAWRFDGVDPSAEMLGLARTTLGPLAPRVHLHEGYIDGAPAGPFDGATCLLTLHFLPANERLRTLQQLRARLRPGAPLVVAHHSFDSEISAGHRWLARNAAFAAASGVPTAQAEGSIAAIRQRLPVLSPQQDADQLREAGFTDIELFYCAFTFKGVGGACRECCGLKQRPGRGRVCIARVPMGDRDGTYSARSRSAFGPSPANASTATGCSGASGPPQSQAAGRRR